jgi:signal transduction histidine kinase
VEQREYFNFAIDGAQRLDAMLLGLLDYSRIGRQGEPPAWIDSRVALDEALLFLRPLVAEAQAAVRIAGEWPRLLASPDELLRLLQNLVGNALKFRVEGRSPVVTLNSDVIDGHWRFCVADNGVGILPEQIGRLFKVFQRLQSRTAYEGTGIGLALCRKIAENHDGRIWAESAGEDQGSRFCVELPLRQEDGEARP